MKRYDFEWDAQTGERTLGPDENGPYVRFEDVPQWIACSERLPEEPGHYLVIWRTRTSLDYKNVCTPFDVLFWSGGKWWAPVNENQPVTHFMPLPAPPEVTPK